jgi:mono/diheme cytochrome c family protein
MRKLFLLLTLALVLGLAACGGGGDEGSGGGGVAGNASAGEALFAQTLIDTQPGCITCHSLEPGVTTVGPSVANIGAEAETRVSGQSAADYLLSAIVEPQAYVVEGFSAGIMPATYGDVLTEQQINDLVAYLLSLK